MHFDCAAQGTQTTYVLGRSVVWIRTHICARRSALSRECPKKRACR
jgi:hypothetical protein